MILNRLQHHLSGTKAKNSKLENEQAKDSLPIITTGYISERNKLIYVGVKLVYDKIVMPLQIANRNTKPAWEIRLEKLI